MTQLNTSSKIDIEVLACPICYQIVKRKECERDEEKDAKVKVFMKKRKKKEMKCGWKGCEKEGKASACMRDHKV